MTINERFINDRMFVQNIKSKKDLLKSIDMSPDTFNKKIRGERDWKLNELWRLSQTLDCEVQDLLLKKEGD